MPTKETRLTIPVLLGLLICAAAGGFPFIFDNLARYDDEGFMTMTVRRFLNGEPLYDRVWTVYGPFYYFYEWAAHVLTGLPASHELVRFVSLFFWMTTAVLMFVLVFRTTRSLLLASVTFCVGFRVLRFIGQEPAHPQELCVFLLICFALAAVAGKRTLRMAALGALTGVMLLTKINLGIFAGIALALAFAYAAPRTPLVRLGRGLLSAAALMFPAVLMRGYLGGRWALTFCLVVMASLAGVMVAASKAKLNFEAGWRDILASALGFCAAVAAGVAFAVLHGSTLHAIFQSLVVIPSTSFIGLWFLPTRIRWISVPWAAAALAMAWFHARRPIPAPWIALLKIGMGLGCMLVSVGNLGNDLLGFGLPFQWLLLVPPQTVPAEAGAPPRPASFARMLLAFVSVLQVLYAYPVAGSQVWVVSVFLLPIAAFCFIDGFADARAYWPDRFNVPRLRLAGALAWLLMIGLFGSVTWRNLSEYQNYEALDLPGSKYVRIPSEQAADLRRLVSAAAANCETLLTVPAMPSFNLWSGAHMPPELSYAHWMQGVEDAEQHRLVQVLSQAPRVCAIYSADMVGFWTHGADITKRPLMQFILHDFHPTVQVVGYELRQR